MGWASSLDIEVVKGFEIISDDEEVGVFWFVEKVGLTTGWTTGQVLNACVHTTMAENSSFILQCQHRADYVRAGGDSGAPVFSRLSQPSTQVKLFGIHNGVDPQGYAYFSPISGVRADLGAMSMVAPDPPQPPPPPPPFRIVVSGPENNLAKPYSMCLYSASASGGTPPYSYSWHSNGTLVGTGASLYFTAGTTSFTLEVTALDAANKTAWNALPMTVDPLAPDCLDM